MGQVEGKIAIVTGAASGIGAACAETLAREGAKVVVSDLQDVKGQELVATIGKTPEATRGLAIFAVLIVVMLSGAWVPMFLFPQWLQKITVVMPTRWAMDGLEAMTWRGLGLGAALLPIAMLLAFAALFGALAVARFRWEVEG